MMRRFNMILFVLGSIIIWVVVVKFGSKGMNFIGLCLDGAGAFIMFLSTPKINTMHLKFSGLQDLKHNVGISLGFFLLFLGFTIQAIGSYLQF